MLAVLRGCVELVSALKPQKHGAADGAVGATEGDDGEPRRPSGAGSGLVEAKSLRADGAHAAAQEGTLVAGEPQGQLMQLYEDLCQAFNQEKALGYSIDADQDAASFARLDARVRQLLGGYLAGGAEGYRRYVNFCDTHYVRNLVEMNDDFELMVICWRRGQASRVHNHANSHGWLMPLSGEMEEDHYLPTPLGAAATPTPADAPHLPGVLRATSPCPLLHHTGTARVAPGDVAYINDHDGLHAVRCPLDCPSEEGGITLHLYAPPIRRVKLFEPENDRVVQRVPGFFTMRGQTMPVDKL